jgi:predicted hydrocarbon binding protein
MVDDQQVIALIRDESVLIDRGAIGELYETALRFVGIGIGGILYTAGKKGGARGAQLLRARLGLEGDDLLTAALLAFNQSNWGKATLVQHDGGTSIRVENSALAGSMPAQKKNICHPLAGYIAGFLEEAWNHPVKVRETECIASGGALCVFQVE